MAFNKLFSFISFQLIHNVAISKDSPGLKGSEWKSWSRGDRRLTNDRSWPQSEQRQSKWGFQKENKEGGRAETSGGGRWESKEEKEWMNETERGERSKRQTSRKEKKPSDTERFIGGFTPKREERWEEPSRWMIIIGGSKTAPNFVELKPERFCGSITSDI